MKILFLPNFPVYRLASDDPRLHPANKIVDNEGYWFFKYWPGTKVDIIDSRSSKMTILQQLKALLRENNYDVIISHHYLSGFLFSFLRSVIRKRYPPHIIFDIGCLNGNSDKFTHLIKLSTKSIAGIIYHSRINERFYNTYTPDIPRTFVYFGEDPEIFRPFDSPSSKDYILSFGYSKRDYVTLLRVWKRNKFNVPLIIVGKTRFDLPLPPNVQVFPKTDLLTLKKFIHNAKFVILPIENEPYSVGQMSLIDSMTMKKAVIVNKVPGVLDYVKDGKNALFTTYKSEKSLVEKIRYLLDNPSEVDKISKNARKFVIKIYNDRNMSLKVLKFINQIIQEGS